MKHPVIISSKGITTTKYRNHKSRPIDRYICTILESTISIDPRWAEQFMTNKNIPDPNTNSNTTNSAAGATPEDFKDTNLKYNLSKFEYDLYHEEDDVAEKVIRVKRVSMPNKGEKWKIMVDNKVTFVVEGSKLGKKERDFLNTVEGFNFMLKQAKIGIKSFNALKNEIKKALK